MLNRPQDGERAVHDGNGVVNVSLTVRSATAQLSSSAAVVLVRDGTQAGASRRFTACEASINPAALPAGWNLT